MLKLRQAIENRKKEFDEAVRKASDEKVARELFDDRERFLCRNDLFYLACLLGYEMWQPNQIKGFVIPFHRDFCDKVSLLNWQVIRYNIFPLSLDMLSLEEVCDDISELGKPRRLFLMFRSSYKSTIVTKLHTIQLLLNFPDIHITISHNTQINASDILVNIKELFLNPHLRRLFLNYVPKTKEWGNQTGFSVACKKSKIMTGDNVEAIGTDTQATGRKAHIFKNDDIVTEDSVSNEEQLRQSNKFLDSHKNLFVNPSFVLEDYSDTKYHFADATTTLENDPDVETIKTQLLEENPAGEIIWQNKKHICVLPEHFTKEGIGKEQVSGLMKNPDEFNLQYMLCPDSPRRKRFTREMIQTIAHIPEGLNYYLLVDPADSEEKRACYTAMKVIGVDHDDNWYWVDGLFDKIDDRQRIDEAIFLAKKWRVFEVLWEYLSFGRTDARNFERASRLVPSNLRTWASVRAITASRISKDDRILGLNDRYSRRKIFWLPKLLYYSKFEGKTIDLVEAQEYEFLGFPLVSHKDLLDAESFMLQIDLIKGDRQKEKEVSKFAYIKDPVQRGNTEVFWHNWEICEKNGFREPSYVQPDELLI